MKKRTLTLLSFAISIILCLSVFAFVGFANEEEPTGDEVTLTVTAENGAKRQIVCSFNYAITYLEEINPTVPTTYEITLNKNAVHTETAEIAKYVNNTNKYATVIVNLAGYTLLTKADGGLFIMNRAIDSFTLDGGYGNSGKRGVIVSDNEYGEVVFVMKNSYTDSSEVAIRNLTIISEKQKNDGAIISCNNGSFDMYNTELKIESNAPAANPVKAVRLSYVCANINGCVINDASENVISHGLHATGDTKLTLQNSIIKADTALYSADSRSESLSSTFILINNEVYSSDTALYVDCDRTYTALLGGTVNAGDGNVLGGRYNKDKVFIGLGAGKAIIKGSDTDSVKELLDSGLSINQSGEITYDYLADASYVGTAAPEAILTSVSNDGTVLVTKGTLSKTLYNLSDFNGGTVSVTLLKDISTGTVSLPDLDGTNVCFSLNGHTLNLNKGSDLFNFKASSFTLEGKGGNINLSTGSADSILTLEEKGSCYIRNLAINVNSPACSGSIIKATGGLLLLEGISINCIGDSANGSATESSTLIYLELSGNSRAVVKSATFNDQAKYNTYSLGFSLSDNAFASVIDSTVKELNSIAKSDNNAVLVITDSALSSRSVAYLGSSYIYLSDTETSLNGTSLTSGDESKTVFIYKNGLNKVTLPAGMTLSGGYIVEDGYVLAKNNEGIYVMGIKSSLKITSDFITTKKLQEGAIIEIDGTCDRNGATVTVRIDGEEKSSITENGKWSVKFGPLSAKTGVTVSVTEEGVLDGTTTVSGVNITKVHSQSISLPIIFANNMVLQRQMPINVTGYGKNDGMAVRATLKNGSKVIATATSYVENGCFTVTLPEQEAAYSLTLTVEELNVTNPSVKTFTNVNVGEIWVVSGQSNSDAVRALHLDDMEEYYLNSESFDNIRLYTQQANRKPYEDKIGTAASWYKMDSSKFSSVAATAYVAMAKVAATLGEDVPIAIIHAAHSSSIIAPWISEEEMVKLNEEAKANMANSDAWNSAYSFSNSYLGYLEAFKKWYDVKGRTPGKADASEFASITGYSYAREDGVSAAHCYNALFAHMKGFSARGVIWYQGESDIGKGNIESYPMFFDALTNTFKTTFNNDELSMIVMQIAPYGTSDSQSKPYVNENKLARFKAIQEEMCRERENTYLVSTATNGSQFAYSDLYVGGGSSHIHPTNKSPLGVRAANIILYEIYGLSDGVLEYNAAPKPIKAERVGNTVVITFDSELYTFFGKGALGFEMSDATNHSTKGDDVNTKDEASWYSVEGKIVANTVVLTIPEGKDPQGVRYAHGNPYVENRDGTLVEYNYSDDYPSGGSIADYRNLSDYTPAYITDVKTGVTYIYYALNGDIIRMLSYGNITNESGEPMPLFKMDITK